MEQKEITFRKSHNYENNDIPFEILMSLMISFFLACGAYAFSDRFLNFQIHLLGFVVLIVGLFALVSYLVIFFNPVRENAKARDLQQEEKYMEQAVLVNNSRRGATYTGLTVSLLLAAVFFMIGIIRGWDLIQLLIIQGRPTLLLLNILDQGLNPAAILSLISALIFYIRGRRKAKGAKVST